MGKVTSCRFDGKPLPAAITAALNVSAAPPYERQDKWDRAAEIAKILCQIPTWPLTTGFKVITESDDVATYWLKAFIASAAGLGTMGVFLWVLGHESRWPLVPGGIYLVLTAWRALLFISHEDDEPSRPPSPPPRPRYSDDHLDFSALEVVILAVGIICAIGGAAVAKKARVLWQWLTLPWDTSTVCQMDGPALLVLTELFFSLLGLISQGIFIASAVSAVWAPSIADFGIMAIAAAVFTVATYVLYLLLVFNTHPRPMYLS